MRKYFSADHALEGLAALVSIAALLGVLQTFLVGRHFVIPTLILLVAIYFGNLARFAARGDGWARHLLFWTFALLASHAFFALFWAAEARPGALFGAAFYPLYGGFCLLVGGLCLVYARRHALLS